MRAILFDVSGTILDTKEHIFWQFEALTKQFDGAPATRSEIAAAMKGNLDDVLRALVKNKQTTLSEIKAHHDTLYRRSLRQMRLYPGTIDLLVLLRRLGYRTAAVTSGDSRIVEALDFTGARPHFDIVVTDEHVAQPKPHPEGIHYALTHMGVLPENAVMVGDSAADIEAGRQAGVRKTIAVLHGFGSASSLQAAGPTHIIDDMPALLDVVE